MCRICLEPDPTDDLFSPCRCAGTARWVHRACLRAWLAVPPPGGDGLHPRTSCEICGSEFRTSASSSSPPPIHARHYLLSDDDDGSDPAAGPRRGRRATNATATATATWWVRNGRRMRWMCRSDDSLFYKDLIRAGRDAARHSPVAFRRMSPADRALFAAKVVVFYAMNIVAAVILAGQYPNAGRAENKSAAYRVVLIGPHHGNYKAVFVFYALLAGIWILLSTALALVHIFLPPAIVVLGGGQEARPTTRRDERRQMRQRRLRRRHGGGADAGAGADAGEEVADVVADDVAEEMTEGAEEEEERRRDWCRVSSWTRITAWGVSVREGARTAPRTALLCGLGVAFVAGGVYPSMFAAPPFIARIVLYNHALQHLEMSEWARRRRIAANIPDVVGRGYADEMAALAATTVAPVARA